MTIVLYLLYLVAACLTVVLVDDFLNNVEQLICEWLDHRKMRFVHLCVGCGNPIPHNDFNNPVCSDACFEDAMRYHEVNDAIFRAEAGYTDALFALNEDGQLSDEDRARVESAVMQCLTRGCTPLSELDVGPLFNDAASSGGDSDAPERMEAAREINFDDLDSFLAEVDDIVKQGATRLTQLSEEISFTDLTASYADSVAQREAYYVESSRRDPTRPPVVITDVTTNAWDRVHRQHSVRDAGCTERRAPSSKEEARLAVAGFFTRWTCLAVRGVI
jgi:hypothetical protein